MESPKEELEKELTDLIGKYSKIMRAGPITESIIGTITCTVCAASLRTDELDYVEQDLKDIISFNINLTREYLRKTSRPWTIISGQSNAG